jgi:proteic killer suppression protein
MGYTQSVITSFKHKGLEKFFTKGIKSGIQAKHAELLRLILGRLSVSTCPRDVNLPGLNLHELSGDRQGIWSVKVSGNWRVTFRFASEDVADVDYEDYH